MIRVNRAQVDAFGVGSLMDIVRVSDFKREGVEPRAVNNVRTCFSQTIRHRGGDAIHTFGYFLQACWAVIDRIHARHNCQQCLRSTNI